MEILVALAIVLAVITLVGHGIWVLLAKLFSLGQGPPASLQRRHCPKCHALLQDHECRVCGWPTGMLAGTADTALRALREQIERFGQQQLLDPTTCRNLLKAVEQAKGGPASALDLTTETATPAAEPLLPTAEAGTVSSAVDEVIVDLEVVDEGVVLEEVETSATEAAPGAPVESADAYELEPRTPEERVRRYVERQVAMPAEVPRKPAAPQRAWSDVLSAFMEEKNIRWGELVGGLLIVCCSIALVISFWAKIAERPFLKFFVFNGVTAALFAVGFYTERRWKLRTTSRGLLVIGTLLVPLNFLAIAAFNEQAGTSETLLIAGELISIVLFAGLVGAAGTILTPGAAAALGVGVMLPAVWQLIVRRLVGPDGQEPNLMALAAVPIACHALANGWLQFHWRDRSELAEVESHGLLRLLGLTTFSSVLPLGLLLAKTGQPLAAAHQLSPLVCAAGLAPLAAGLFLVRRLPVPKPSALLVAGTSVSLVGAAVALAALVLAWPEPALLLPVALAEVVLFSLIAIVGRLPAAHVFSVGSLALAYLLGFYLWQGAVDWHGQATVRPLLISGTSGMVLAPLVALLAVVTGLVARVGRRDDAAALGAATAGLAAISLLLVSAYGLARVGDPFYARWIYAAYAVGALAWALAARRVEGAWLASGLALAAMIQAVVFRWGVAWPWLESWAAALVAEATLATWARIGVGRFWGRPWRAISQVFTRTALVSSTLAVPLVAGCVWQGLLFPAATLGVWLGLLWLLLALVERSRPLSWAAQAALYVSVALAVAVRLSTHDWFDQSAWPWLDPWTIEAVGLALSVAGLAGLLIRWGLLQLLRAAPGKPWHRTLRPLVLLRSAPDRLLAGLLTVVVLLLACYAALPGVLQELSPRSQRPMAAADSATSAQGNSETGETVTAAPVAVPQRVVPPLERFEILAIPHAHALGRPAWLLLGAVLVLLAAGFIERPAVWQLVGFYVLAAAASLLIAGRWEDQTAVASALRWTSALLLLFGSLPIWLRSRLAAAGPRVAQRLKLSSGGSAATAACTALFLLALAPPVMMALAVGVSATLRVPLDAGSLTLLRVLAVAMVAACIVAIGIRALASDAENRARPLRSSDLLRHGSSLLVVLTLAPLLALLLYGVGSALRLTPILGPDPDSIFVRMGRAMSFAFPVLLTACVLVGYAVRERSAQFAFAAGLAFNFAITAGYLFTISRQGLQLDASGWIRLAQLNALVTALYALAWMAVLRWRSSAERGAPRPPLHALLQTSLLLAAALVLLVFVPIWCDFAVGDFDPAVTGEVASPLGCAAALAVAVALVWASRWSARQLWLAGEWVVLFAVSVLLAGAVARWRASDWDSFHALLVAQIAMAWLTWLVAWRHAAARQTALLTAENPAAAESPIAAESSAVIESSSEPTAERSRSPVKSLWTPLARVGAGDLAWVVLSGVLVFVLCVRAVLDDPAGDGWGITGLVALGLLAVAIAYAQVVRRWLFVAQGLFNLAVSVYWFEAGTRWLGAGGDDPAPFVKINIMALALGAVVWTWLELRRFRPLAPRAAASAGRFCARASLVLLAILVALGVFADVYLGGIWGTPWFDALTLASVAAAAISCLWDPDARDSVAQLYLLGLVAIGLVLSQFHLGPGWMVWIGTIVLAAYGVLTSYLWSIRGRLATTAAALGIPVPAGPHAGLTWLVPANCVLVSAVVGLSYYLVLTHAEFPLRLLAAQAALAQVISLALLAQGARRTSLQYGALIVGALALVAFGWAWIDPRHDGALVERLVLVLTAVAFTAVLYGFGLARFLSSANEWRRAALRLLPVLVGVLLVVLVSLIASEAALWAGDRLALASRYVLLVVVVVLGLVGAALAAAVLPGRDPLGLSERGRTAYVYAAELLLALLFAHVRLTMPWLFHGFFQAYWPLVVMAIAFLGAGFGELFARRQQRVLAEPLGNTAVLLPLLPALGFWLLPAKVDYSLVLLSVGSLYAMLSAVRRSFALGLLATLSANGALWFFWHRHDGFRLLEHPQLWLIPPALCVLAAAYLHRQQLSAAQLSAVRYATSIVVYVSSTADIFLNGVADNPWLPLVLAALSILGVLAGIWLRVRAFLLLGTSFLVLALLTIIWYAAVDLHQTWIWAASGIVAGVLIIAVFAVFEKKRDEVLRMMEELKRWEG